MSEGAVWLAISDTHEAASITAMAARLGFSTTLATTFDNLSWNANCEPLCAIVESALPTSQGRSLIEQMWNETWSMPVLMLTVSKDAAIITSLLPTPLITALARPYQLTALEAAFVRLVNNAHRLRERHLKRCNARDRIHGLPSTCRSILTDLLRSEPIKRIARRHDLSTRTIEMRKKALFDHLGVGNYAELFELCALADVVCL